MTIGWRHTKATSTHVALTIASLAVHPIRCAQTKHPPDKHLYAQRHLVECCFSKLKQFRRVASRFEKTARNYRAVVTLAAIIYGCVKCPHHLELGREYPDSTLARTAHQDLLLIDQTSPRARKCSALLTAHSSSGTAFW